MLSSFEMSAVVASAFACACVLINVSVPTGVTTFNARFAAVSVACSVKAEHAPQLQRLTSKPIAARWLHTAGKAAITLAALPCRKVVLCMLEMVHQDAKSSVFPRCFELSTNIIGHRKDHPGVLRIAKGCVSRSLECCLHRCS